MLRGKENLYKVDEMSIQAFIAHMSIDLVK